MSTLVLLSAIRPSFTGSLKAGDTEGLECELSEEVGGTPHSSAAGPLKWKQDGATLLGTDPSQEHVCWSHCYCPPDLDT